MKVIKVIQSTETDEFNMLVNEPVEMKFYVGDDKAKAISALASAVADIDPIYYTTLSVRVDF